MDSIPGLERPLGGGNGNPLKYSCLENPMERGAWRATVHQQTRLSTRMLSAVNYAGGSKEPSRKHGTRWDGGIRGGLRAES